MDWTYFLLAIAFSFLFALLKLKIWEAEESQSILDYSKYDCEEIGGSHSFSRSGKRKICGAAERSFRPKLYSAPD